MESPFFQSSSAKPFCDLAAFKSIYVRTYLDVTVFSGK